MGESGPGYVSIRGALCIVSAVRVQMDRGVAVSCSGQGILKQIKIRLEYGFERWLTDKIKKRDIDKGLGFGMNQSLEVGIA